MNKSQQTLRIFGDSILKGVVYSEKEDRYVLLEDNGYTKLGNALGMEIQANALFGCTVTKGMQLLKRAIHRGIACDVVLLEYGGNDCDFLWDEVAAKPESNHFPNTPLTNFDETLRTMINMLKSISVIPLLMTLPPIDSDLFFAHICRNGLNKDNIRYWLKDIQNIGRHQEQYSAQIKKIASETGTKLIDIRSRFEASQKKNSLLCKDGIHPNTQGNALIMQILATQGALLLDERNSLGRRRELA
ncbi:MAG: SGNH/GDSL hydrolase family protein [Sphaerochaetaceae bacterium]|nr:SGNH/GDSL hydrolase family protein [Sphaerochaetaceae bacterium]